MRERSLRRRSNVVLPSRALDAKVTTWVFGIASFSAHWSRGG